ncbi:MAG: A/G-specific adenine glycosylase [Chromatiales bacterium]|nr:A/G-specific adenine glycosylase [Chromatiales bacterium]
MNSGNDSGFAPALLAWFDVHGRKDLPWQHPTDPYRVWVSEIMLQQTQVTTVIPYFQRFMARFANVAALAAAPVDDVLELWAGLGYYARARNLHRSARMVMEQHAGSFPVDIEALRELPGIGRSTAGAILAQAFEQREPILDGNVKRVLTRYYAIEGWPGNSAVERELWELADAATPTARVRDYTQAIMDLGATLCTRTKPDCAHCPLAPDCIARRENRASAYPEKKPRARKPERSVTVLLLHDASGAVLLQRRPPTGIWGGLWSLPELPTELPKDEIDAWCHEQLGLSIIGELHAEPSLRHEFTHFSLTIEPLRALAGTLSAGAGRLMEGPDRVWYNARLPSAHGMAAPIRRLIERSQRSQQSI